MKTENIRKIPTPAYVIEEAALLRNLEILQEVMERTGARILLAQKAFSMYSLYPLIGRYLAGTTASGLYEAMLGREEMSDREVHVFSPAYKQEDMEELTKICDHIIFNSVAQWKKYKDMVKANGISAGIRVNPQYSEVETAIYDPCGPHSRLGVRPEEFAQAWKAGDLEGIEGIHFHTMCEQGADVLERTLKAVEKHFGDYLFKMKWLNFGGGHHITKPGYDIDLLIREICRIQKRYQLDVYIEPGEAVAWNAGVLISQVLETRSEGEMHLAILDTSAACHMPDVLEMPYRPQVTGSGEPWEKQYTYRMGGPTCLAGDIIGDYSFDCPLEEGQRLEFQDMAIYSMVKNNTFNGMPLPAIILEKSDGTLEIIKEFGYEDFKQRLS